MKISDFSNYLEQLDNTTKRLEITAILTQLITDLDPKDIDKAMYMALGMLKAPYENLKFNVAEKMVVRVVEATFQKPKSEVEALYAKLGDLGDVVYEISNKKTSSLSLMDVYNELTEVANHAGSGSQEQKIQTFSQLLNKLDACSAKYVTRMVLGTTRLGFSEITVIDALSQFIAHDKSLATQIEEKYSIHPDIGLIAKIIKTKGIQGLDEIQIETGIPILSQRCQRLSSPEEVIEKMEKVWAEFKFDGTRVQLHLDRKKAVIKTFTRNQEESTHQFPDILDAADNQIKADSVILDGEAIAYNKETGEFLPLQETMQRKRKHNVAEMAKNIPLKYFVFDILYLNGASLLNKTLEERRELLKRVIKNGVTIEIDSHVEASDVETLTEFFEEAKEKALEGIIVKKTDSIYQAGARAYTWVKLKKMDTKLLQDTIDAVVLGYSFGKGMRTEFGIGKFLVGVYDSKTDRYKTICKVGTGLKDHDLVYLKEQADKIKLNAPAPNVDFEKRFTQDVWIKPQIVVELGADEISRSPDHSAGYALRFPRLITFRTDKKPTDSTSLTEIIDMFNRQKRGVY